MKLGSHIDRYTLVEQIGDGGMATVYGVRHRTLGTPHALKVLTVRSTDVKKRLLREGKVQAKLQHRHLVSVTDVLQCEGAPALLMEYIDGPPLDWWLMNCQPTVEESLIVFRGIVLGVGFAHAQGVIHRDLKPANILLDLADDGLVAKVADFGLAKSYREKSQGMSQTRTGAMMGTPAFMPPEQINDVSRVDRRADIYALGCILYQMVCGELPFRSEDLVDLLTKIKNGDYIDPKLRNPDLPMRVCAAIDGMLATDAHTRLTDCQSVLDVLDGEDIDAITMTLPRETSDGLPPPREITTPGIAVLPPHRPGTLQAHKLRRQPMPTRSLFEPDTTPAPAPTLVAPPASAPSTVSQGVSPAVAVGAALTAMTTGVVVATLVAVLGFGVWYWFGLGQPMDSTLPTASDPIGPKTEARPKPETTASPKNTTQPDRRLPSDSQPKPTEPKSDKPKPAEPTPAEPKPAAQKPVEPKPVEPKPVEPKPVEPKRVEPTPPPVKPQTATFTYAKSASIVGLVLQNSNGKRYQANQPMPAGRYSILLTTTDDADGGAGYINLEPGQRVRIKCNDFGVCGP